MQDRAVDETALRGLIDGIRRGTVSPDDALGSLRRLPFADLGFARIDHHRPLRQGMVEAVYGPGKTPGQAATIVTELLAASPSTPVVLTRADPPTVNACTDRHPHGVITNSDQPSDQGRAPLSTVVWRPAPARPERVVVVTAGTADLPVADECAATLHAYGLTPARVTDVGVAGLHRLVDQIPTLVEADAVVVVAGMEGALASVVGGLTGAPVVAVPTSTGYGSSLEGITALLSMLASCAAGVTVVGIDNGFGAAGAVARMFLNPARTIPDLPGSPT